MYLCKNKKTFYMVNIISDKTLKEALNALGLEELPSKWDRKSSFEKCIVKIGDMYVVGAYDDSDAFKYRVKQTFICSSYKRSSKDIIYPILSVGNKSKPTKVAVANIVSKPTVKFADINEAKEWLKERGVKGTHLMGDEKVVAKIKEIIAEEQNK